MYNLSVFFSCVRARWRSVLREMCSESVRMKQRCSHIPHICLFSIRLFLYSVHPAVWCQYAVLKISTESLSTALLTFKITHMNKTSGVSDINQKPLYHSAKTFISNSFLTSIFVKIRIKTVYLCMYGSHNHQSKNKKHSALTRKKLLYSKNINNFVI